MTSQWKVNVLGKPSEHEVSVVREDFKHGFISWGWPGAHKRIVSSTAHWPHHLDVQGWKDVKACAQRLADRLNGYTPEKTR